MAEFQIDDDFDFGFTSIAEDEINKPEEDRARAMYDAIMPLLRNLARDADKNAYIHWPDRSKKIDQFITKLNVILNS